MCSKSALTVRVSAYFPISTMMHQFVKAADSAGLQIAIHALGVIPSTQPYHCIDDGRWAEKRLGTERSKTTFAFRSLLDAGANLSFGSDWFVAPLDPIQSMYAAVTRQTLDGGHPNGWVPEQEISVAEEVRCYTLNDADAEFAEKEKGSLEVGKEQESKEKAE